MPVTSSPIASKRRPTGDEWRDICALFDRLAALPSSQRKAALEAASPNAFIRAEVSAMLDSVARAGVLDARPDAPALDESDAEVDLAVPGTRIGMFEIKRQIGSGGAGVVYLAHRSSGDFEQRVALKVLRPEAAGQTALFESERRTLSSLEHPGIARLIDGGTTPDGRIYMAMEYVDGTDIAAWCRASAASLETRLALVAQVCDAVAYAHRRLIVHRDLKPSNILVDADGRARLLDFGIAGLTDAGAEGETGRVLLTPEYAAPEQLEGHAPTTAMDVYGLGATLYEVLAGRPLWQFRDAALPAVLRRLVHETPAVVSVAAAGGAGGIEPRRLRGDLDAVVAKAVHPDAAQRYGSVEALATDLDRYRRRLPVAARDGSRLYRAGRFMRRHPWGIAATAAAVVALLAGTAGIAWQVRATAVERDIAVSEARRAEAINEGITLMFRSAGEAGTARTASANDLLDATAAKLIATIDPNDPRQAAVIFAFAELYGTLDDAKALDSLLTQALAKGVGGNDPVMTAEFKLQLASAKVAFNQFADVRQLLAEAAPIWASDPARFRTQRLEAIAVEAYMRRLEGDRAGAIKLLQDRLPEAEQIYPPGSRDILTSYNNLALHLIESNRLDEAAQILARAEAGIAVGHSEDSSSAIGTLSLQGGLASKRGDKPRAESYLRRAIEKRRALFGPSVTLASDLSSLGRVLLVEGKPAEALPVLNEALSVALAYMAPSGLLVLVTRLAQIEALAGVGLPFPADLQLYDLAIPARKNGTTSLEYGVHLRSTAAVRLAQGRIPDALAALGEAEAVFRAQGIEGVSRLADLAPLRARIEAAGP